MLTHWTLIFVAAGANVILNMALKRAGQGFDTSGAGALVVSILTSGWMWVAGASAVVLLSAFVAAIRVYSLSVTYTAVTAIAMVTLTVIGVAFQSEQMTLLRGLGLAAIIAGLALTAAGTA